MLRRATRWRMFRRTKFIVRFRKYPVFIATSLRRKNGLHQLNHAGSARGITLVANTENPLRLVSDSDAHLRSIIAKLEENRSALVECANPEAAQIVALAILQLRMRLHRLGDSDLRTLCHAMLLDEERQPKDRRSTGRGSGWPNPVD